MKGKNIFIKSSIILSALIFIISIISCESMDHYTVEKNPSSKWSRDDRLVRLVAELRSLTLETGEIWWKDVPETSVSPKRYSVDSFYASLIIQKLDDGLSLLRRLDDNQRRYLYQVLCNNLPLYERDTDVRLVAVGNYFGKGRPLVILITKNTLEEGLYEGVEKGMMFLTNAYRPSLKPARKDSGISFSTDYNVFVSTIPFPNGICILPEKHSSNYPLESEELTPPQKVDLMDLFCFDEIEDNDYDVMNLYREIMVSEDSTNFDRKCAVINYGLVFFKVNDLDGANRQWSSVSPEGLSYEEKQWIERFLGRDRFILMETKAALE